MKGFNVIDAVNTASNQVDALCEIPQALAKHLEINPDGTVNTADILRVAYMSAYQSELIEESIEHLDLMDAIFNADRAYDKPNQAEH